MSEQHIVTKQENKAINRLSARVIWPLILAILLLTFGLAAIVLLGLDSDISKAMVLLTLGAVVVALMVHVIWAAVFLLPRLFAQREKYMLVASVPIEELGKYRWRWLGFFYLYNIGSVIAVILLEAAINKNVDSVVTFIIYILCLRFATSTVIKQMIRRNQAHIQGAI